MLGSEVPSKTQTQSEFPVGPGGAALAHVPSTGKGLLLAGTPAEDKSKPLASPRVSQGEGVLPGNSGRHLSGGCNAHGLPEAAFPLARRHRTPHAPGWKPTPSLRHGTPPKTTAALMTSRR